MALKKLEYIRWSDWFDMTWFIYCELGQGENGQWQRAKEIANDMSWW